MKKGHIIDILFPIALFWALAASAFPMTLLAADVYKESVALEEENYAARTCLSYVVEKIRQSDEKSGITLGNLDGIPCLMLRWHFGERTYVTYLYHDGGVLRELLLEEGMTVKASDGQEILQVRDFQITMQQAGIFKIVCGNKKGCELAAYAAVISRNEMADHRKDIKCGENWQNVPVSFYWN